MDNSIGNLLIISGDNQEDVKQFIESFLSPDPESDDPNDKCIDFYKIIPVNVPENECERMRQWGVMQNATNTSVIYEEGGKPEAMVNKIYFDTEDTVPKIVKALAEKRPDLYYRYEYCDDEARYAGELVIEAGYESEEVYEPRGEDTMILFHELWGRYNDFVLDKKTGKYVSADETETEIG